MTPSHFKQLWMIDDMDRWVEFNNDELNKAPIANSTKEFLQVGFPEDAAPFLDFGWRSYNWKFNNIAVAFRTDSSKSNYWHFGSDGSGNPICFDSDNNDRVVLLDHEQDFDVIDNVNSNIHELAQCLLVYRDFINKVLVENGENAFLDPNFSKGQFINLESEFKEINSNIFKESGFWRAELQELRNEYNG